MKNLLELSMLYQHEIQIISILLISVGLIGALFMMNKKIKNIENSQKCDIDDVTSFNRLIDDEIGILKKEQEEISQAILDNDNQSFTSASASSCSAAR